MQEMPQHMLVSEAVDEHFFVIADKNSQLPSGLPFAGECDDPGRVWAPIDQVAQKDGGGFGCFGQPIVFLDRPDHSFEQIEPPMDVSDGVNALARRDRGTSPGGTESGKAKKT